MVYSLNHVTTASFTLNIDPEMPKSDLALLVEQSKDALICPWTSLKGAKTLNICPIQMWEALKVVYSLNHVMTASFPLDSDPDLLNSDQALLVQQSKDALMFMCPRTSLKIT